MSKQSEYNLNRRPWAAILIACVGSLAIAPIPARGEELLKTYPSLQKFLFAERKSNLYFGFGVSPMTIQSNRIGFSANLFQVHVIKENWDLEIFSGSFGLTMAQQDYAKTKYFRLRTAPKLRILKNISIGPVAGLEFVHFGNLNSKINRDNYFTPQWEPFSTYGFIYGLALSQTFSIGGTQFLKINEIGYIQTYPHETTRDGWRYYFQDLDGEEPNLDLIKKGTVFMLEVSFLL